MQPWSWGSGLVTGTVKNSVAKANKHNMTDHNSLTGLLEASNAHDRRDGHLRLCATIKHVVANELDEPLRNLFQWASFASHCLRPELSNTVPRSRPD